MSITDPIKLESPDIKIDTELEKLKNELHRKLGRNIILFQKIELILKTLLARGQISGYASELNMTLEEQVTAVGKQTMGKVVKGVLENIFSDSDKSKDKPEELKEPWLSFNLKIQAEYQYDADILYEKSKNRLASIVAERNELVHHFLLKWNFNSMESFSSAEQYLDQQYERILPEFEYLKGLLEDMKAFTDFMVSDEFHKQFELLYLRESRLVLLLREIAMQKARSDGWVMLSSAAQLIRQHAPEEMEALEERYGYKKLKGLILATGLFDINEEVTDKGGVRVLYRVKSEQA
ncbi:MAG: OST-HTH/LOTUS domain-containing protein [Candidatus Competibacteraceae bacterium]